LLSRVANVHQVSVATFYENDFELRECDKLRPFCRFLVPVYRRGKPAKNIFPYEPFDEFNLPEMWQALDCLRRESSFDIVHFEYTQMGVYADQFPDSRKFLTEIEVNYGAAYSKLAQINNPAKRLKWYYNALQVLDRELALCRKVDHVICVNETDAGLLRDYLPRGHVHVVHTGVDIHHFKLNGHQSEESDSIGFVGAFRHEPNVDAALFFTRDVLPLIQAENPRAKFYLIGANPSDDIKRLHNGCDIYVTGFVDDLLDYYHRMSVIVVPLRTGVGIRGKILEAWAAGKPVVGTALAAAGIEARQGENIYIADSPAELAQWTTRLLENRPARQRMALHGRKTAEDHYDWDRLAQRLCDLYKRAVK
jgi:glycosyltransferase involved in cell wall biosynthesis